MFIRGNDATNVERPSNLSRQTVSKVHSPPNQRLQIKAGGEDDITYVECKILQLHNLAKNK